MEVKKRQRSKGASPRELDLEALAKIDKGEGVPLRYFYYLFAEEDNLQENYAAMRKEVEESREIADLFFPLAKTQELVLEQGVYTEKVFNWMLRCEYTPKRGFPILKGRVDMKKLEKDDLYNRICEAIGTAAKG